MKTNNVRTTIRWNKQALCCLRRAGFIHKTTSHPIKKEGISLTKFVNDTICMRIPSRVDAQDINERIEIAVLNDTITKAQNKIQEIIDHREARKKRELQKDIKSLVES